MGTAIKQPMAKKIEGTKTLADMSIALQRYGQAFKPKRCRNNTDIVLEDY
jgi:hypothetical protein